MGHRDSPSIAIKFARSAGTVVIVGIFSELSSIHFNDVVFGERTIVGSCAYAIEPSFILEMMAKGKIEPSKLITGRIQLKDVVEKGFKELLENKDAHLKILVESPNWSLGS